jgi:hypothetical protein
MIEGVLRAIVWVVLSLTWILAWWVVSMPVMLVVATPMVLLCGLLKKGKFVDNVCGEYRHLWDFWSKWGVLTAPPW